MDWKELATGYGLPGLLIAAVVYVTSQLISKGYRLKIDFGPPSKTNK
jgi:hypothetical protein